MFLCGIMLDLQWLSGPFYSSYPVLNSSATLESSKRWKTWPILLLRREHLLWRKNTSDCEKVLMKYILRDRYLVCFTFKTVMVNDKWSYIALIHTRNNQCSLECLPSSKSQQLSSRVGAFIHGLSH